MGSKDLRVVNTPEKHLALTNCAYVHPNTLQTITGNKKPSKDLSIPFNYGKIKDFILNLEPSNGLQETQIGLNQIHRRILDLSLNDPVHVLPFPIDEKNFWSLTRMKIEVDLFKRNASKQEITLTSEKLAEKLYSTFSSQIFTIKQQFAVDLASQNLVLTILQVEVIHPTGTSGEKEIRGIFGKKTELIFVKAQGSPLKITGATSTGSSLGPIRPDWNFSQMGIGGLGPQFNDIFRRAFASRVFPASIIQKLGIQHLKGILLYGPPGTGKTLMARKIGEMLHARPPKIVNGPEILNKYVGQSEENIRNLFREAESDYLTKGEESELHMIIFDEIDAICKSRGTSGNSGVGDSVVNQLLSKIDGVQTINNILIIGMTNRKDLIDEALLRPGRLEMQMEIGLPDAAGRLQILEIHTSKMRTNGFLSGVDLEEIAASTKNFTGAEIEGLVKSATSFAFNRQIDASKPTQPLDNNIQIIHEDFKNALEEITPAFGYSSNEFENKIRNGIIDFGPNFRKVTQTCKSLIEQVKESEKTPLITVLLQGSVGSGKTALASSLALEANFPFARLISPDNMIGYSETAKCQTIAKIFQDAYKSALSIIVLDDIERLLEYVPIGARFSNAVLQTLYLCLKKEQKGNRLLVIGTTSNLRVLEDMLLIDAFNAILHIPNIRAGSELAIVLKTLTPFTEQETNFISEQLTMDVPIKTIIMLTEMAKQGDPSSVAERFIQLMIDRSLWGATRRDALYD